MPGDAGAPAAAAERAPLLRLFVGIVAAANIAATAWILLLMLLIVADVLGRNLLGAPIAGVPEMVKYSIVGIVFLQIAHTHRAGAMIRSDGILNAIAARRPRLGRAMDAAAQLAGAALTLVIARAALPRLERAWTRGEFEGAAGHFALPVWPFIGLILLGATLLAMSFLLAAFRALRGPR